MGGGGGGGRGRDRQVTSRGRWAVPVTVKDHNRRPLCAVQNR